MLELDDEGEPDLASLDDFAAIYSRYLPSIVRYLRRRLGADAAEDAAADVFVRALRHGSLQHGDSHPLPWLYGIAANVILECRRSERRRLRALERLAAEPRAIPFSPDLAGQLDPLLMRGLRTLSRQDRETLLLIAWGELSYAETASALRIPIGTVRSRVARARAHLHADAGARVRLNSPSLGGDSLV
jgi:RNA polymerase sigma factor (sigma-70 family)